MTSAFLSHGLTWKNTTDPHAIWILSKSLELNKFGINKISQNITKHFFNKIEKNVIMVKWPLKHLCNMHKTIKEFKVYGIFDYWLTPKNVPESGIPQL